MVRVRIASRRGLRAGECDRFLDVRAEAGSKIGGRLAHRDVLTRDATQVLIHRGCAEAERDHHPGDRGESALDGRVLRVGFGRRLHVARRLVIIEVERVLVGARAETRRFRIAGDDAWRGEHDAQRQRHDPF